MSSRNAWYDAFAAASMSCLWMGAWPPAMWLPHVYGEPETHHREPDNPKKPENTHSFRTRLMRHGRAPRGADRSQGVNDGEGRNGTAGGARARA